MTKNYTQHCSPGIGEINSEAGRSTEVGTMEPGAVDIELSELDSVLDNEDIRNTAKLFLARNEYIEVRAIGAESAGVIAGYFNDPEALLNEVIRIDREYQPAGIYITLNQVSENIIQVPINILRSHVQKTTTDKDIVSFTHLLIDIDPTRPSKVSSTEIELFLAEAMVNKIYDALCCDLGWPEPIEAMSGNGFHLVFGLDMSCNDGSINLIRTCLTALNSIFSTDACCVDAGNYNPSRIGKLFGTVARKGSDSDERPHRVSHLISAPDVLSPVSREQLMELQNMCPYDAEDEESTCVKGQFGIEQFVREHIPEGRISKQKPFMGGTLFELSTCPFNPDHTQTARLIQFPSGAISFGCFHQSCQGKGWRELKTHLGLQDSEKEPKSDGFKLEQVLLAITKESEFFVDQYNEPYAGYMKNGLPSTARVESQEYIDHLVSSARRELKCFPSYNKVVDFSRQMASTTRYEGHVEGVHIRTAVQDGKLYIDLCNSKGQVVEIGQNQWRIITDPLIRFIRTPGMLPQVLPSDRGNVDLLCEVLNVEPRSDAHILLFNWMMNSYFPDHEQPLLVFDGRESSGKTTAMYSIRMLIDPSAVPHRALPAEARDFIVNARNSAVLAFDNTSGFNKHTSNRLCRISTGSGFGVRRNYTDGDEFLFNGKRPVMVSGITSLPEAHDLIDRSVVIHLDHIRDGKVLVRSEMKSRLLSIAPHILAGVYDAVSYGLAHLHEVDATSLPRMADFARLAIAAEPSLPWENGRFIQAYLRNRAGNRIDAIANDSTCSVLLKILKRGTDIRPVTATELLDLLLMEEPNNKELPRSPNALGKHLRNVQTSLEKCGVYMEERRSSDKRSIIFTYNGSDYDLKSFSSAPSCRSHWRMLTSRCHLQRHRWIPGGKRSGIAEGRIIL